MGISDKRSDKNGVLAVAEKAAMNVSSIADASCTLLMLPKPRLSPS